MQIHIFTIFPEMLESFLGFGLLAKARESEILDIQVWNIRNHPDESVDFAPYGGGPGMVLQPEPIYSAVEKANPPRPLYLLAPTGRKLDQNLLKELSGEAGFSLICGRYEGVDARVSQDLVDGEISLGDFVVQGGEVAAMAIMEGVGRLLAGALGNADSTQEESFADGLLEYPQYTRPDDFRGMEVPPVLLSGDHQKIERWRRASALFRTQQLRPDLIEARGGLTPEEKQLLEDLQAGKLDG